MKHICFDHTIYSQSHPPPNEMKSLDIIGFKPVMSRGNSTCCYPGRLEPTQLPEAWEVSQGPERGYIHMDININILI